MVNQKTVIDKSDEWQTILSEIDLKFIPSEYIVTAKFFFESGKVWEVDLSSKSYPSINSILKEIREDVDEDVIRIGFEVNMEKVKRDVSEETERLLAQM